MVFLTAVLGMALQVAGGGAEKLYDGPPIKVLLVTGGGAHDYKTQATLLPEVLKARANMSVEVWGPNWGECCKKLKEPGWAKGYDIVVYNICDAGQKDTDFIHGIVRVHEEGGVPAVIIHGALHSFHWNVGKDRKQFEGEEWLKLMGIVSASHGRGGLAINVKTVKAEHPIMKGLPAEWKTPNGELYNSHQVLPSATPLAMGDNGDKKQGPQVCVWVNQCGKAKVFGTSLGHHNETMKDDTYGKLLVRGMLWACGKLK